MPGAASADADALCDEDCNRAAAPLQRRGPILSVVTTDGRSMGTQRRIRHKIFEWLRRYAPNEIAGSVGQRGAAAVTYELTGSYAAAVIAATIGTSAGYYAAAYFTAVRWSYRGQAGRCGCSSPTQRSCRPHHRRRVRAGRGDR